MFFCRCAKINLFSTTHLKPTEAGREYKASAAAAAVAALTANRVATLQSGVASRPKKGSGGSDKTERTRLEAVSVIALINILCWPPLRMEEERRGEEEGEVGRGDERRGGEAVGSKRMVHQC